MGWTSFVARKASRKIELEGRRRGMARHISTGKEFRDRYSKWINRG